jgi:hypothetical protein
MPKYNISINALSIQGAQRLTSKTGKDCLVIDLDASRIQRHQNGKLYLNLEMSENRDGEDQYRNSHRVAEPTTKDERGQGIKTPILGNAKTFYFPSESKMHGSEAPMKQAMAPRKMAAVAVVDEPEGDDIPF